MVWELPLPPLVVPMVDHLDPLLDSDPLLGHQVVSDHLLDRLLDSLHLATSHPADSDPLLDFSNLLQDTKLVKHHN